MMRTRLSQQCRGKRTGSPLLKSSPVDFFKPFASRNDRPIQIPSMLRLFFAELLSREVSARKRNHGGDFESRTFSVTAPPNFVFLGLNSVMISSLFIYTSCWAITSRLLSWQRREKKWIITASYKTFNIHFSWSRNRILLSRTGRLVLLMQYNSSFMSRFLNKCTCFGVDISIGRGVAGSRSDWEWVW